MPRRRPEGSEAEKIKQTAGKEAEETRKQMETDLDTAARNFVIMVQERLEKTIVEPTIEEEVRKSFSDDKFLQKMIEILIVQFTKVRKKAEAPLVVQFTDKTSFGFKIGIEGTGQHFNFGDGLVEVLLGFCSPRFRKYFFTAEEK
jgi:hypothetical protein